MTLTNPFFPFSLPAGVKFALLPHDEWGADEVMLSETELSRISRLRIEGQRADLMKAYTARRRAIGVLLGVDTQALDLRWSDEGAPWISAPGGWVMSASGIEGLSAIALVPECMRIGVDIACNRVISRHSVFKMISNEDEACRFEDAFGTDGDTSIHAFHRLWTIKEAVLKATGRGMKAGPKNVPVVMDWLGAPSAAFSMSAFGMRFMGVTATAGEVAVSLVVSQRT